MRKLAIAVSLALIAAGSAAVVSCSAPAPGQPVSEGIASKQIASDIVRICDKDAGVLLYIVKNERGTAITSHSVSQIPAGQDVC